MDFLLDLPKDITSAEFTGKTLDPKMDLPGYTFAGKGKIGKRIGRCQTGACGS